MTWIFIETAGSVSLYVVFRNLVAPVITSGETTWGYRELQVFRKLEHRPRHYTVDDVDNLVYDLKLSHTKHTLPRLVLFCSVFSSVGFSGFNKTQLGELAYY